MIYCLMVHFLFFTHFNDVILSKSKHKKGYPKKVGLDVLTKNIGNRSRVSKIREDVLNNVDSCLKTNIDMSRPKSMTVE